MHERLDRLHSLLDDRAPELAASLRPPASATAIVETEAEIGLRFPPSVRAAYRVHDGQRRDAWGLFAGWWWLPLEAVIEEWERMRDVEREFAFGDWDPDTCIPLMTDGGGNLLYVEHAPGGDESPVIEWFHEVPTRDVRAPSFAGYVDAYADALADDEYVFVAEDGVLVHRDDL